MFYCKFSSFFSPSFRCQENLRNWERDAYEIVQLVSEISNFQFVFPLHLLPPNGLLGFVALYTEIGFRNVYEFSLWKQFS